MINPNVSVDCVVFGFDGQRLNALLIEQEDLGQDHRFALPGDHLQDEESLDEAASRVLKELTGLTGLYLRQCGAFGDPNRVSNTNDLPWLRTHRSNPEARVITIAYYALVKMEDFNPSASGFAKRVFWADAYDVPALAFDHNDIFNRALGTLRKALKGMQVGFKLLPEKFTLTQMQSVHEVILRTTFDKRNFRKKVINDNWVIPLEEKQTGVYHKPARLYRWSNKA